MDYIPKKNIQKSLCDIKSNKQQTTDNEQRRKGERKSPLTPPKGGGQKRLKGENKKGWIPHQVRNDKKKTGMAEEKKNCLNKEKKIHPSPPLKGGNKRKKYINKIIKYVVVFGLLIGIIVGTFFIIGIKNTLSESLRYTSIHIQIIKNALKETKTGQLKDSLMAINQEIKELESKIKIYKITELFSVIGQFNKSLEEVPGAFKNIAIISDKITQVASDIDYLKNNAIQLIFNQKGGELIDRLNSIKDNLYSLEKTTEDFRKQARELKDLSPRLVEIYDAFDKNYPYINLSIYKGQEMIEALVSLLEAPEDVKILLLFQNATEIRPAGGFIGSFGYITLNNGSIKEIKIEDIYNSDRQLDIEVAPPRELSTITDIWGARDANWFFDFPDSAQKVSCFLENSQLFNKTNDEFENVIAINPHVLSFILNLIGPIEIPEYDLVIDSSNFLEQLQYEVEAGRDHVPGQNPKLVLTILAPKIIERLKDLDDDQKLELIENIKKGIEQKDIMAFSENEDIQKIFLEFKLDGTSFSIPKNFNGDYLAVVNSNVAGGKSDAFINQQIQLQSQILKDGNIVNKLSITRTHSGQNEKDWWYTATNKNYSKILIPKISEIISVDGNDSSPYDYLNLEHNPSLKIDEDLKAIEENSFYVEDSKIWRGEEKDKQFVGTWINTPAGETKTLILNYEQIGRIKIEDGSKFTFVFDKQSGDYGSLEYEVATPIEYIWEESGGSVFTYGTQQIKSREVIELTLKKQ
ncbi:DUF4012 domain-containing protein [Patescibacteria group bacterium]|nr:DUF4012 domain-containing protein [Patescibacteria group bacterium]